MQDIYYENLTNPEIFQVNRLKAHSDHKYTLYGENPIQSLNGNWSFKYYESYKDVDREIFKPEYNIESLEKIIVPGHLQMNGYGVPQYVNVTYPWEGNYEVTAPQIPIEHNPAGCYIKDIELSDVLLKGSRKIISFQGVESAFFLYVNGKMVGYSEDSFTPAEFDITDYLVRGKNRIGVEVYRWCTGSWLEDQDFFRFFGIFRDVYLYAAGEIHFEDLFVHTDVEDDYKSCVFSVDGKVSEDIDVSEYSFSLTLKDKSGNIVLSAEDDKLSSIFGVKHTIENVKLWSAEEPYLYVLELTSKKNGVEVEKVVQKIGMRRFEMKNKIMHINGKRIEFYGVNRHEFDCRTGRAITKEDMLWDIKFLKQHNINAVRTSHYPNNSLWYELCDEHGIYLIDEANLETHGTWSLYWETAVESCVPGNNPIWKNAVLDRANSMVQRDKNHPSVLIWSCGNESFGGEIIYLMSEFIRELDSSRLVHYEGIFKDRRYPDTSDIESRMYEKVWNIEEYLNDNPAKPFICCEYMHSMGNSCGGIKDYTDLLDKYPMYQGGFIWDYIDQAIIQKMSDGTERMAYGGDFDEVPDDGNFCGNGIVFADRTPSAKAQEVKFVYGQVILKPEYNKVKIVNKRLFTDTSDMSLKIQLLRDGEVIKEISEDVVVEPLSEKETEYDFSADMKKAGEYFVQASFHNKQETFWAEKGYEQFFGRSDSYVVEAEYASEVQTFRERGADIVHGPEVLGIHYNEQNFYFSRRHKGLFSLKYNKEEIFVKSPQLVFYRAETDNDRGCNYMLDSGVWKYVQERQQCIGYHIAESDSQIKITLTYELPICEDGQLIVLDKREKTSKLPDMGNNRKGIKAQVIWNVKSDKSVDVKLIYEGAKGLPELPLFGMEFVLKNNFENFKYYGLGPEENYADRNNGAKIGIFESTVTDNYAPYLKPQACGNRTETRWLDVTDGVKTIRFASENNSMPFQFTVLHYNENQLEEAAHKEELPDTGCTYVKIMPVQLGVGGDDSWGSQVREHLRVMSDKRIEYDFTIKIK